MKRLSIVCAVLMVLVWPCVTFAVDCPIPDTGQTKCYNNSEEITCPSPGEPFYGQDAQYAPCNPHSYTKLDENGDDLPDAETDWVMVKDNVTGLIWEVKTDKDGTDNYANPHDADNGYFWYDGDTGTPGDDTDTLDFINALKTAEFGGHNDWRLPTIKELSTLVDSSIPSPGPTIHTIYFPNTVSSMYWSSTTYASDPNDAWSVYFSFSYVDHCNTANGLYVRAVRGGQCGSFDNFVDNGDGTVTDSDTGLMWQQDTAPGTYTWQQALSYCENLSLGRYSDWRLPNRNELQSIVNYSQYDPCIDTYFPNTVSSYYWSSTSNVYYPNSALYVYFFSGLVRGDRYGSKVNSYFVRAVRGGQCGSSVPSCPTEQIYGEHSEKTELLRHFRDNVLSQTTEGKEIIRLYYQWSPVIVKAMEKDEEFKEQLKEMIDGVLELVGGEAE